MRNIILTLLFAISLIGCFEDEGNYEYKELKEPLWLFDKESMNIDIYARMGRDVLFKASDRFTWGEDSLARLDEVRFEWRVGDVVIGDQVDFTISAEELVKKLNLEKLPDENNALKGTFRIIEKESEITYMCRFRLVINPYISTYDWIIMSEQGEETKLSVASWSKNPETGKDYYELMKPNDNVNHELLLPGKPIDAAFSIARHVGPLGSVTAITDKGVYEIDNTKLEVYGELKDEFLDGTPVDFNVVARRDIDGLGERRPHNTFLATADGNVYTRQMSANWLGGKFLSEPYIVDDRGYKITRFGHTLFDNPIIPCFDEKNGRMLMAQVWEERVGDNLTGSYVYKSRLIEPKIPANAEAGQYTPVWNMPGVEMLFVTAASHFRATGTQSIYTLLFNDASGQTLLWDFVIDNRTMSYVENMEAYMRMMFDQVLPVKLNKNMKFLTSCNASRLASSAANRIVYSNGNEVRFIKRGTYWYGMMTELSSDNFLLRVDSPVTYLTYDYTCFDYGNVIMMVGCENGDVFYYDITNTSRPELLCKFNVGGKVVSAKLMGTPRTTKDLY